MKISCIIPTYNEAPRIEGVLRVVVPHPLIDEVIIVDDGSKDATREIVEKIAEAMPKVKLIKHEKNQGKSAAIATGVKEAQGEFCIFIDADLIGLTSENVTNLINPVIEGAADVTISLRGNTPGAWKFINLDYISGERVMPTKFLRDISSKFTTIPKFGLESYMNSKIIKNKFRIKVVKWMNVESPFKYKKVGSLLKGALGEAKMIMDIFRTITPLGPVYQIIRMKQLEVK